MENNTNNKELKYVLMDSIIEHTGVFFDLNFNISKKNGWRKIEMEEFIPQAYNTFIDFNNEEDYTLIMGTDESISNFFLEQMLEMELDGEGKNECKLAVLEEVLNTILGNSTQEMAEKNHSIVLGIPEVLKTKDIEKINSNFEKVYICSLKLKKGLIQFSLYKKISS